MLDVVAGVKLDAGLGGEDFHDTSRFGLGDPCGGTKGAHISVQYQIVIVSPSDLNLLVARADPLADGVRLAEVEGSTGYGTQLSSRD